jgi:hypothetical protein
MEAGTVNERRAAKERIGTVRATFAGAWPRD